MAKRRHYTLHHLMKFSPAQLILTFYLGAILMTTSILALPFFYQEGVNVPLVDVLFVSVSAISVTGLTTVPIGETFNRSEERRVGKECWLRWSLVDYIK